MIHFGAHKRISDGRWDYCSAMSDGKIISPVGYCGGFYELSDYTVALAFCSRDEYDAHIAPMRQAAADGKYHSGGHATKEEAEDCYKAYLLDFHLRFSSDNEKAPWWTCQAEGCGVLTNGLVFVGQGTTKNYHFCPEHSTRAEVEKLFTVGSSWHW